ncbi:putative Tic20 family protein [Microbacteriaceae bacterium SG_E_30_P1]|uniref:Tic20 family protein n=1 Tax=Antiquaquibacter oligotrophicus TaxID=2880260 RepID=A0ABT6KMG3_9MICO|nr:DUF4870 domain-containing protein [Antiquaquibacter oligotrophicus]MDH6181207.1 putative Tic20 family protein [Antiquaquibacter oligotrophicus]UDF13098.1 DUF4870 domain-containing protein [Antiquaquibacter oligotrophicus]
MPEAQNPYANPVSTAVPLSPAEEKQWAVLTHVLGIFFGVISAAAFYFIYRDRGPFVKHHTATEWNFQLTLAVIHGVSFLLAFPLIIGATLPGTSSDTFFVAWAIYMVVYLLNFVLRIVALVLGIRAAVAANRGSFYTYPSFRFVKVA